MIQSKAILSFTVLFVLALLFLPSCSSVKKAGEHSSPETTLKKYIDALGVGDRDRIAKCFHPLAIDFYLPQPVATKTYVIRKKIVYGDAEVQKWNSKGIIPPASIGDVELQVEVNRYDNTFMFSYNFRKIDSEWKIISHAAWGQP